MLTIITFLLLISYTVQCNSQGCAQAVALMAINQWPKSSGLLHYCPLGHLFLYDNYDRCWTRRSLFPHIHTVLCKHQLSNKPWSKTQTKDRLGEAKRAEW